MLRQAPTENHDPASVAALQPEPVAFESRTGGRIVGRFFGGTRRATVILTHGEGRGQDEMPPLAGALLGAGLSVLTYERRGGGEAAAPSPSASARALNSPPPSTTWRRAPMSTTAASAPSDSRWTPRRRCSRLHETPGSGPWSPTRAGRARATGWRSRPAGGCGLRFGSVRAWRSRGGAGWTFRGCGLGTLSGRSARDPCSSSAGGRPGRPRDRRGGDARRRGTRPRGVDPGRRGPRRHHRAARPALRAPDHRLLPARSRRLRGVGSLSGASARRAARRARRTSR